MKTRVRAVAVVLGAVIGVVALAASRGGPPQEAASPLPAEKLGSGFGDAPSEDATRRNPFAQGEEKSLAGAEQDTGFNAPQPHHEKADESQLVDVFVEVIPDEKGSRTSTNAVNHMAMTYSSGLMIVVADYSTLTADKEPAEYYALLSKELGGAASVETIKDVPAMIISPTKDHLGSVDLVLDGLRITIYGHVDEFTEEDLREIASSLD